MLKSIFILLLFVISIKSYASWEDYKKKTLQQTISENSEILNQADIYYTPGIPQLVFATYTGKKRVITEDREKVIRGWVKVIGQQPEIADLFLIEIAFEENGKTHWLPVQKPLIAYLEKELTLGEKVSLYAVWVGTTKKEWVFVVNEFKKINR